MVRTEEVRRVAAAWWLGGALLGCVGAPAASVPAGSAAASSVRGEAASTHEKETHARVESDGLAHPANDPEVVALARKLLDCKWREPDSWPEGCDAEVGAWDEQKLDGKATTLVHMLQDTDARVRFMAAWALGDSGGWTKDKELAEKVLAALEGSSKAPVDPMATENVDDGPSTAGYRLVLGQAAGRIDPRATDLQDRMVRIALEYPDLEARAEFVGQAQSSSPEAFFAIVLEIARTEKNDAVRRAALDSFWTGTPSGKQADVCALWLDATRDPSERIASRAAYLAAFTSKGCPKEYDALVELFDEKTKGKLESNTWSSNVKYMAGNGLVPERNRKALMAIGKRIAEKKENAPSARSDGLRAVYAADEKAGKALAKRLREAPEEGVKQAAEEILAMKKR